MGERRRAVLSAVAATAVFAGAVVVIVVLGRTPPPVLPSLADQPEPRVAASVAYLAEGDAEHPCVAVVDLSDGSREVWGCPGTELFAATLADDGQTVRAVGRHPGGRLVLTLDADGLVSQRVDSGDEPPRIAEPVPGRVERADGTRAVTGYGDEGAEVTVLDADGRVIAQRAFDGGDYAIRRVRWTDDGQWLLLWDSAGRLLVADEHLGHVRVAADDVASP